MGGGFVYAANRHEPGTKVVMGHKIKSGGQKEGLELLHILATSPSTARSGRRASVAIGARA